MFLFYDPEGFLLVKHMLLQLIDLLGFNLMFDDFIIQLLILAVSLVILALSSHYAINAIEKLIL